MAADYSRIIFFFNIFIMFMILIATVACFLAPSYLTPPASTATSIAANFTTARSLLYAAGAVGAVVTIIYIIYFIMSLWTPALNPAMPETIMANKFGWGTVLFVILMLLFFIFMLFLIIYAITLIDTNIKDVTNGYYWAIAAVVLVGIVFVLHIINLIFYYLEYSYINTLIVEDVKDGVQKAVIAQAEAKLLPLGDVFLFTRNPATKNSPFEGTISVTGKMKQGTEAIVYNGEVIKNTKRPEDARVNVEYNINELTEQIDQPRRPMNTTNTTTITTTMPVRQPEIVIQEPVRTVQRTPVNRTIAQSQRNLF